MKMFFKIKITTVAALLLAFAMSSCAHQHVDKDEKEIGNRHVVSIGSKEVTVGEKIDVLREVCRTRPRISRKDVNDIFTCSHQYVGDATIVRLLDENKAEILVDSSFKFEPTFKFEKKSAK